MIPVFGRYKVVSELYKMKRQQDECSGIGDLDRLADAPFAAHYGGLIRLKRQRPSGISFGLFVLF